MLPDRVSNLGPLTYEAGALPIAPRGPAVRIGSYQHLAIIQILTFCRYFKEDSQMLIYVWFIGSKQTSPEKNSKKYSIQCSQSLTSVSEDFSVSIHDLHKQ